MGHALVDAMMAGGVTVVEVTMTVPDAVALLRDLKQKYGEQSSAWFRHGDRRGAGGGND